jgi:hypothetical protein
MANIKKNCPNIDPFVGIAAVISGVILVMVLFLALFARDQMWIMLPVGGSLAFLGAVLGFYMSRPHRLRR